MCSQTKTNHTIPKTSGWWIKYSHTSLFKDYNSGVLQSNTLIPYYIPPKKKGSKDSLLAAHERHNARIVEQQHPKDRPHSQTKTYHTTPETSLLR